jgi:glycosyltransferase involved in cell wall biosynthesis
VTNPLLSVVIPTWNRAHLVCEAIESALSQRAGQVEVIVVDDGSTDDTADVLARRFGSSIHLLHSLRRRGPGAARNAGARRTSGELIAFLDSDDLWLPGKLDAELRALERFPEAEAVVSDSLRFLEGEADERSCFALNGLLAASEGQVRRMNECPWLWTNILNGIATCSITLRRRVLARFEEKLFAEDLVTCEDWEFELRVYHLCQVVVVLPEVLSEIRRFDDGSRPGRARPGKPPTREQEMSRLRDRLTVMDRSHWLSGLDADLAGGLERSYSDTARQLARLENEVE